MMRGMICLVVAGAVAAAAPAGAAALFVFGDSLVDTGNVDAALRARGQPTRAYVQGRFTNGYTFADTVSQALGQGPSLAYGYPLDGPTSPYFYGGNNFAYGGALARGNAGPGEPLNFLDQVGLFASSGKSFAADDVVLVTFGGNDIQQEVEKRRLDQTGTYRADFGQTVVDFQRGLTALALAGARNIVVTGEADIGLIPNVTRRNDPALDTFASDASEQLNGLLDGGRRTVAGSTGATIQFFDLLTFERDLLRAPAASGLTNTTAPCLNQATGTLANPTCAGYLYFDPIHPTTAVHTLIGRAIVAQALPSAVPEPAGWMSMVLGFGAVGSAARYRRRRAAALA